MSDPKYPEWITSNVLPCYMLLKQCLPLLSIFLTFHLDFHASSQRVVQIMGFFNYKKNNFQPPCRLFAQLQKIRILTIVHFAISVGSKNNSKKVQWFLRISIKVPLTFSKRQIPKIILAI